MTPDFLQSTEIVALTYETKPLSYSVNGILDLTDGELLYVYRPKNSYDAYGEIQLNEFNRGYWS